MEEQPWKVDTSNKAHVRTIDGVFHSSHIDFATAQSVAWRLDRQAADMGLKVLYEAYAD